jgi:hypothetical protein
MLFKVIECDRCRDDQIVGLPGEHAHLIRKRARERGWRQMLRGMVVDSPNGPVDVCPKCVKRMNPERTPN